MTLVSPSMRIRMQLFLGKGTSTQLTSMSASLRYSWCFVLPWLQVSCQWRCYAQLCTLAAEENWTRPITHCILSSNHHLQHYFTSSLTLSLSFSLLPSLSLPPSLLCSYLLPPQPSPDPSTLPAPIPCPAFTEAIRHHCVTLSDDPIDRLVRSHGKPYVHV